MLGVLIIADGPPTDVCLQIRLSILLTYLFGKSPLFVSLLRLISSIARLATEALQPVFAEISEALAPLSYIATASGKLLLLVLQPLATAVVQIGLQLQWLGGVVFGLPARAVWQLLLLLWQLLWVLLQGPLQLLRLLLLPLSLLQPMVLQVKSAWGVAKATGAVAKAAAPGVLKTATAAAAAAGGRGGSGGWWWPWEALGLMRQTTVKIVKALQSVVRFWVALGTGVNRHRLSLLLQLRWKWRQGKRRLWLKVWGAGGEGLGAGGDPQGLDMLAERMDSDVSYSGGFVGGGVHGRVGGSGVGGTLAGFHSGVGSRLQPLSLENSIGVSRRGSFQTEGGWIGGGGGVRAGTRSALSSPRGRVSGERVWERHAVTMGGAGRSSFQQQQQQGWWREKIGEEMGMPLQQESYWREQQAHHQQQQWRRGEDGANRGAQQGLRFRPVAGVQRQELKRRGEGRRRSSASGTLGRAASTPLLLPSDGLGAGLGGWGGEDEVVRGGDSSWERWRGRGSTSLGGGVGGGLGVDWVGGGVDLPGHKDE